MITGHVTDAPEAIITLRVRGPAGHETHLQAVIDTGFTDYLILPPAVVSRLALPFVDVAECELADNHLVSMEAFEVSVEWHGSWRDVLALAAEGDALIGMSLLRGSRMTIDVLTGGRLTIKPLSS